MSKKKTKPKAVETSTVMNWVTYDRESHTDKLVHGGGKKKSS